MMTPRELLKQERQTCLVHCDRLQRALEEIQKIRPLTPEKFKKMTTFELAITELLIGRFSKLQDVLGERIFPFILMSLGEDIKDKSFIDRLHLLEKLGYLEDAALWFVYRRARNAAAHEYPDHPEMMVKNLEELIGLSQELLTYWQRLDQKILKILSV